MILKNQISIFFRNFIFPLLIVVISENVAYSQISSGVDSIKTKSEYSSEIKQNKSTDRKAPAGFYRTDSIFSFRSQKGYFPSLVHNMGVQAAAPFHFKGKEWIIYGYNGRYHYCTDFC